MATNYSKLWIMLPIWVGGQLQVDWLWVLQYPKEIANNSAYLSIYGYCARNQYNYSKQLPMVPKALLLNIYKAWQSDFFLYTLKNTHITTLSVFNHIAINHFYESCFFQDHLHVQKLHISMIRVRFYFHWCVFICYIILTRADLPYIIWQRVTVVWKISHCFG